MLIRNQTRDWAYIIIEKIICSHQGPYVLDALIKADPAMFIGQVHLVYLRHKADSPDIHISLHSFLFIFKQLSLPIKLNSILDLFNIYSTLCIDLSQNSADITQERVEKVIMSYIYDFLEPNDELFGLILKSLVNNTDIEQASKIVMVEYFGCVSLDYNTR